MYWIATLLTAIRPRKRDYPTGGGSRGKTSRNIPFLWGLVSLFKVATTNAGAPKDFSHSTHPLIKRFAVAIKISRVN